jgi:hypothetical protein
MHPCSVNRLWSEDGETSFYDGKEGGTVEVDEKRDFKLSSEDTIMKSEQTSIFIIRYTAAVLCYMSALKKLPGPNAAAAFRRCSPLVRALISHHRLSCLLYDRDLRSKHVEILCERQIEFDHLFTTHVIEQTARVKAHMLMCKEGFPRQLKMYGSLSHADAKMFEMGHLQVTDRIRRGMTNDKEMAPTLLTSINVAHSYECMQSDSGAIELAMSMSERAFSSKVDDEVRQSQEGYASLYSRRWASLRRNDQFVFDKVIEYLRVPERSVLDVGVCHSFHIFRAISVMGYHVTSPQEKIGRDVVCFRKVVNKKLTRQFGRVHCMFAGSDREVYFAIRMLSRVRPNDLANFPFYMCDESVTAPLLIVHINNIVCPVSLLRAPEGMSNHDVLVKSFIVVTRHVSLDLPEEAL